MVWIIKIRPLAYVDLDNIILRYNFQREGLGQEFLIEFNKSVRKLEVNPYAYLTIFKQVRRLSLKRFPYKILFTINEPRIAILGIAHHKRSNRFLRRYK